MSAVARLAQMPDWPARMSASVAALYLGISEGAFHSRVEAKALPAGVREGGNVLWSRRQLDAHIDAQFGMTPVSIASAGAGGRDASWDDLT